MAPITRIALLAIPDAEKQEAVVKTFGSFATECKKDGKPYLVQSHAAKCSVLADKSGASVAWTIVASITFANQEDMDYYHNEDPIYKTIVEHMSKGDETPVIAVGAEFAP
ncbi:hypothetical protein BX600DRAFT_516312 [Xylariales sp. PMI_506]|nr:hypothetical protein BX600DRAFT_516312 [Xylariales sp. PMI_506]